jgi:FkbM family methyltransferase
MSSVLKEVPKGTMIVRSATDPAFFVAIADPNVDTMVSALIYKTGLWDVHIYAVLSKIVVDACGKDRVIILDVGSNLGYFSQALLSWGCEVWAFEMQEEMAARVELGATFNGALERLHVVRGALSNKTGNVKRVVTDGGNFGGVGIPRADWKGKTETVVARTLDEALQKIQGFDVLAMKLDVEGHELQVLQGAVDLLKAGRIRHILMEFSAKFVGVREAVEILDLLFASGYTSFTQLDHQDPKDAKKPVTMQKIDTSKPAWSESYAKKIASGGDVRGLGFCDLLVTSLSSRA